MKRAILLSTTVLFSLSALLSCNSTKQTTSSSEPPIIWQTQPVVVDGNNDDWNLPYSYMDSKAKIEYAFSNDKDHLYITMKSSDAMTQRKILRAGMQVWIDPTGEKKKTTAILFPLENTDPMEMPAGGSKSPYNEQGRDGSRLLKNSIDNVRDISLQGFRGCNGGYLVSQTNSCGIVAKIGQDANNELIWEAVVPFKAFYKESIGKTDEGKTMSICFEINALKRPASASSEGGHTGMGGSHGSGMGGGGGRRGGGGGHGGGMSHGSGNGDDRTQLFEPSHTWKKIHLAYKVA